MNKRINDFGVVNNNHKMYKKHEKSSIIKKEVLLLWNPKNLVGENGFHSLSLDL